MEGLGRPRTHRHTPTTLTAAQTPPTHPDRCRLRSPRSRRVNALALLPGDSLLFKRGTLCNGELHPQGSGTAAAPLRLAAYGEGPLPRIIADATAKAALRLSNQQYWEIESLDLRGGSTFGILVESTAGTLHHLVFRDLRVHDVRGPLKIKNSGLVVIQNTTEKASFDDILVDGVHAFNTTQWSGILIIGASNVHVRNAVVHDVQGDGIVVFHSQNVLIARSLAWHTGMQHQQSIGTPNAIWTWQCTGCIVEENEAFLTDSPGVDGGAFDIDFANKRNTVRRNFGHDTAGYCVSVFGAYGPTQQSVVADNLCLNNGMSPRLAQRQGAVLLMTWQGGSLDGVEIHGNRVGWQAPGDTPAIRTGSDLHASGLRFHDNEVWSSGPSFVDPALTYTGEHNRYTLDLHADFAEAQRRSALLPEQNLAFSQSSNPWESAAVTPATARHPWQLLATLPSLADEQTIRATLIQLESTALQYGHAGVDVTIYCDEPVATFASDWSLPELRIAIQPLSKLVAPRYSVRLIAPDGALVREWVTYPGPIDLGLALRQNVARPNFSSLPFEDIRATD